MLLQNNDTSKPKNFYIGSKKYPIKDSFEEMTFRHCTERKLPKKVSVKNSPICFLKTVVCYASIVENIKDSLEKMAPRDSELPAQNLISRRDRNSLCC